MRVLGCVERVVWAGRRSCCSCPSHANPSASLGLTLPRRTLGTAFPSPLTCKLLGSPRAFPTLPSTPPPKASNRFHLTTRASSMEASHGHDNCIFCKIRDGVIPSYKIFESEHSLAFLDAFPMAKGHTLFVPKKHYAFIEDIPSDEAAEIFKEIPKLAKAVRIATGAEGVNVLQNNGSVAGQVVFHVHFHIVPRIDGDGLVKLGRSGEMVSPSTANPIKEEIISALSSFASPL